MMSANTTERIDSIGTSSGRRPLELCADSIEVTENLVFTLLSITKNGIATHLTRDIEPHQLHHMDRLAAVMSETPKQTPYV